MKRFNARLLAKGPGGAWTYLAVPFSVEHAFGTKARVAVHGTINGFPFQNSLMPEGDGTHVMMVSKALQAGIKAGAGDLVSVTIDVDRSDRVVSIPVELTKALATNKKAVAAFAELSYSHRQEFAEWVASAKKEETRLGRAQKAVFLVLLRKHVR